MNRRTCLCCCISACVCVRGSIRVRECLRVLLTGTRHAHEHMPAAPSPQATRWLGSMCLTTDEPALLCVCMRLYWGMHSWMRTLWYMHICRPHRQRRQLAARAVLRRAHPTAMAARMPVHPIFTHPSFFAGISRDRGDAERGHCQNRGCSERHPQSAGCQESLTWPWESGFRVLMFEPCCEELEQKLVCSHI